MAITVTHATVATGSDSGDQVSKNAWNAAHVLADIEPAALNLWVGPFDARFRPMVSVACAANLAVFTAFQVYRPVTVSNVHYMPTAQAGNVDIGIYSAAGTRLASTGSTACPVANAVATVALTGSVDLVPGVKYYAAFATNSASPAIAGVRDSVTIANSGLLSARIVTAVSVAASFPLPSSITLGVSTASGLYYYMDFD